VVTDELHVSYVEVFFGKKEGKYELAIDNQ